MTLFCDSRISGEMEMPWPDETDNMRSTLTHSSLPCLRIDLAACLGIDEISTLSKPAEDVPCAAVNDPDMFCAQMPAEHVRPTVPLDEHGNETSIGSFAHARGQCKPCCFAQSENG